MATRESVLETAQQAVCGDRDHDYGKPEDNFQNIANFWSIYLGRSISTTDVAAMMVLLKVARVYAGDKLDNWVDIAGYAACGGEICSSAQNRDVCIGI